MIKKYLPFLFLLFVWFVFSHQYFIFGKVPFASNYQVNFFPPWNTYQELAGPVKNNAQPDIITQIYPWRYFAIEEWKSGRIPLWNPYSFAGTPHLANYQSGVLFPLNIIFFLPINFIDGWSILVLLQPLLAGYFTYLFLRSLNASKIGSLISAVSFMFCGFITVWMGYATLAYAILFLPLALFSIEKFLMTKNTLYGALLSFSILLSLFSGHFQTSLYFLMVTFSFILFKIFTNSYKSSIKLILYFTFGLLMAMPQLLPSIEFYQESVRSQLFQKMETIPWNYVPTILFPDFYGNPVTRNDWFGHYAEWSSYVGVVGFSLFLYSFFINKSKVTLFFLSLSIITLLLAFNTPLVSLLVALKIPVLSTSAASRVIVLFSFSQAVLAGINFDNLIRNLKISKKFLHWGLSIFIIAILLSGVSLTISESDKKLIAYRNMVFPLITLSFFLITVFVLKIFNNQKAIKYLSFLILLICTFDLLRFSSKWQSFDPKGLVFKEVPTTKYYSIDHTAKRFLGDFTAENSVYYKLQTLNGYDPLYPARYGKFVNYVGSANIREGERSVVNFPEYGEYTPQAIDFLGVNYISHKISDGNYPWAFPFPLYPQDKFNPIYDDGHYRIFENKDAFNKAFVVYNAIHATTERQVLDSMFDSDLKKTAVVENNVDLNPSGQGTVEINEYNPTNIKLNAVSSGNGLLVITDNYYPGWSATVNGRKAKIERVNFTFRGVVIPDGVSKIEFRYLPQSFTIGVYFALIGLFGIIMLGLYKSIINKK